MMDLSPEERAYVDALVLAQRGGLDGEEASRFADSLRGTFWFQLRTLKYAVRDLGAAIRRAVGL